jgi:Gram-negative bacterial TonB protein C-terminal
MRVLLAIVTALLISQYGRAQQGGGGPAPGRGQGGGRGGGRGQAAQPPPPADPGFECFAHIETPEFPRSALQAHVDGTVYIRVQVTPQGAPDKIDTTVASSWADGPKLLTPAVEKAVRASTFKPECAGKTVAVVFRYELHGVATVTPKPATRTEYNIMFIESAPETAAGRGAAAK